MYIVDQMLVNMLWVEGIFPKVQRVRVHISAPPEFVQQEIHTAKDAIAESNTSNQAIAVEWEAVRLKILSSKHKHLLQLSNQDSARVNEPNSNTTNNNNDKDHDTDDNSSVSNDQYNDDNNTYNQVNKVTTN